MKNFWQKLNKPSTILKLGKSDRDSGKPQGNTKLVQKNFWKVLDRPIFCLAPMEEVTDVVFRQMFAKHGKPDVMFTEFVSTDGLLHPEGFERLRMDLKFTEIQRPMVAQIWGNDPEKFYKVAQMLQELGFDGIDVNMGCPQDREIGLKTCAALIREPELAKEIILATKKGAGELPVSVKTRIGYSKNEVETWIPNLLETNPAAIILHGRTKQEKSKVPAHWDAIARAAEIVHRSGKETLIIGNGDIQSREGGLKRIEESKVDGVMVGRGAFGNPWFFRNDGYQPSIEERLKVMVENAEEFNKILGEEKPFVIMRKHFKAYASGFAGAHELRAKLMETKNIEEVKEVVRDFLK